MAALADIISSYERNIAKTNATHHRTVHAAPAITANTTSLGKIERGSDANSFHEYIKGKLLDWMVSFPQRFL